MSKATNSTGIWGSRFGTLVDVTDRTDTKGNLYATFKLAAKGFDVYGAVFDSAIISEMKAATGERVWMYGVTDSYGEGENARKSFKVTKFKVNTPAEASGDEEEKVEEAA